MTTIFFHPSLLLLFLDPGSGMVENQDPGHPGTLYICNIASKWSNASLITYRTGYDPYFLEYLKML